MIQLFQPEWCPFSARVRQRLTELDLPSIAFPVPVEHEERDVMHERTGTREIPALILEDGTVLAGDAEEILAGLDARFDEPASAEAHRIALGKHPLGRMLSKLADKSG